MKKLITTTVILLLISTFKLSAQAPVALDVAIQGDQALNHALTGIYSYHDSLGRPEGNSIYQWYRADSLTQTNLEAIDSGFFITYIADTILDKNKYLIFEVTPVAVDTTDTIVKVGAPVRVWTSVKMYWLGIDEKNNYAISFYPNPATIDIHFRASDQIRSAAIFSSDGKEVLAERQIEQGILDVSFLKPGFYLLRVYLRDGSTGTARLLKN